MERKWRALIIVCVGDLHAAARHHGRQRRAAQTSRRTCTPPSPTCSGSSTPTPSRSPACDAERGLARRPARAASGSSSSASRSSPPPPRSAAPRTSPLFLDPRARRSRASAARSCSPSRSRSSRRSSTAASAAPPSGSGARRSGSPSRSARSSAASLTEYAGWRWIFFVNLPIGVVCVVGAIAYLHESRDEQHGGFDLLGFVTLTGGLFALVLALLRGNDWGWSSGRIGRRSSSPPPCCSPRSSSIELRRARADVRPRALPQADVHRRADRRVRDLVGDVRAVPLPDALPPERARLLAAPGGPALPAALARLVRRRADRGTPLDAHPGAHPARRRPRRSIGVALLLDARDHAELALDDAARRASSSAASASASSTRRSPRRR